MHSYQYFMPGRNSKSKKLISYNNNNPIICYCFQENYKKIKTAENNPNISNTLRLSNILQNNINGKIRVGNTYLPSGKKPFINSLGSIEGQPGGSFRPLRNTF